MTGILRVCVVLCLSTVVASVIGCVVPDPGPGDTLPGTLPTLAPPITFNYRNLGNPITDPSQFPDAELVDLYLPAPTGSRLGMLLWVHGGGWVSGTRADVPAWVLQQVPRGYVVASIGYLPRHLRRRGPGAWSTTHFPRPSRISRFAIRFLRNLALGDGCAALS